MKKDNIKKFHWRRFVNLTQKSNEADHQENKKTAFYEKKK
jgi:hypothetical protein